MFSFEEMLRQISIKLFSFEKMSIGLFSMRRIVLSCQAKQLSTDLSATQLNSKQLEKLVLELYSD